MKFADRMDALKPSDIREVMKIIAANPGTISFAGGLPDPVLFPKEDIKEVAMQILNDDAEKALQYGMTKGNAELMEVLIDIMKKHRSDVKEGNIAVTHGSQQGISLTGLLFLNPGDVVLTETPSYLGAFSAYKPNEINYVGIECDKDGMLMDKLEEEIKSNDKVKMIYVIPNFQNPTGKTWSLERRKALVEIANKYDLPIIEDDAYGELRFDGEKMPSLFSLDKGGKVLYLGSFSKIFAPGMRVGWLAANEEIIRKFEFLKYGSDLQNTEFSQLLVARFIKNCDIESHIEKIRAVYKRRRDLMLEEIKKHFPKEAKYYYPEGGMFIWLELPESVNTRDLLKAAVEKKVAFVPGGSFYPEGDCESSMRLNFSTMDDEKILEGIEILGEILHDVL